MIRLNIVLLLQTAVFTYAAAAPLSQLSLDAHTRAVLPQKLGAEDVSAVMRASLVGLEPVALQIQCTPGSGWDRLMVLKGWKTFATREHNVAGRYKNVAGAAWPSVMYDGRAGGWPAAHARLLGAGAPCLQAHAPGDCSRDGSVAGTQYTTNHTAAKM